MIIIKTNGTSIPETIDKTSSKKFVYVNQNIEDTSYLDEETNETIVQYTWDMYKYTNDEFYKMALDTAEENSSLLEQNLTELNTVVNILLGGTDD